MITSETCSHTRTRSQLRITLLTAFLQIFCFAPIPAVTIAAQMYIASPANNKIVRANLAGSSPEDLGNPGGLLAAPVGIALDVARGRMYITSFANGKVVQANLEGNDATDLGDLNGSVTSPWGIALDSSYLTFLPLLLR